MRALVMDGTCRVEEDYPNCDPPPGEVLVKVHLAAVCGTDLHLAAGYMGFRGVAGHEFVGTVVSGASTLSPGTRVVGEINAGCGRCEVCVQDGPNHCPTRTVLGILARPGAFAEYLCLPEVNLHPVPPHVPDDAAIFVESLAAAFRIPEQCPVQRTTRALVLGDGRLGLLCARVLALKGAGVTVVGRHPDKLALARTWGLEATMEPPPGPASHDLVVEVTGTHEGLSLALQLVRPQGTVVLKSTCAGDTRANLAPIVVDEITVQGSRCGPFPMAIAALASGWVDPLPLISDRFPLSEATAALKRAAEPDAMKVLIEP